MHAAHPTTPDAGISAESGSAVFSLRPFPASISCAGFARAPIWPQGCFALGLVV